jgi:hypothetical protein
MPPVDWTLFADGTLVPIIVGANLAIVVYVAHLAYSIHQSRGMPIGNVIIGNYQDTIFVNIRNSGMGVMKIANLKIMANGYLTPSETTIEAFVEKAEEMAGRMLSPSEELTLLSFGFIPGSRFDDERRTRISNVLKGMTILMCYTDSEEQVEYTLTQDLSLFGRRRHARNVSWCA